MDGERLAFDAPDGTRGDETTVVLDTARMQVRLGGVARRPVLSLLRGFSAPVRLTAAVADQDRYVLMASDPDLFNRWEAGQALGQALILARAGGRPDEAGEVRFAAALGRAMADQAAEPAFKALMLSLPSEGDLSMAMTPADPQAIHNARETLCQSLAAALQGDLERLHDRFVQTGAFSPDADSAGRRALRNAALDLLSAGGDQAADRAARHFAEAGNMTESMGGLAALMQIGGEAYEQALADFYARWKDEPLVVDKWFALQARDPSDAALGRVMGLTVHPAFDPKNPNRLRALVASFAGNAARFHDPSGDGYRFLADQILATDAFNPMIAARLVENLGSWKRYTPQLGVQMREQLERIVATEGLSKNVYELASRAIA